jgi:uncharacterized protein YdiU (UPF0061 family)
VLVRLNHGHLRIGSFQRLATLGQKEELRRLVAYALRHYYGQDMDEDGPVLLLGLVAQQTARMAASFMAAGFVHGVLNSDNINISGESFDYGPWRFTPTFDAAFTAAYFDSAGLYAFGRQAEAIHWDVVQLAIALSEIAPAEALTAAVDKFAAAYRDALVDRMLWRLGVIPSDDAANIGLIQAMESALVSSQHPLDRFFFDWRGGGLRHPQAAYAGEAFAAFRSAVASFRPAAPLDHDYWSDAAPCSMVIAEIEAIWAPISDHDDWGPFETKLAAIRRMGEALSSIMRR